MRVVRPVAALLLIVIAAAAHAQVAQRHAEAQRGGELADRLCGACHDIGRPPQVPSALAGYGPSFVAIANRPHETAQSLQNTLSSPHAFSRMSLPDLSAEQKADVTAYILSLRGRR